jgi:hypothetical protein
MSASEALRQLAKHTSLEKLQITSGPCQLSQFSSCSAASWISNRNDAECPCHRDLDDLAYGQAEVMVALI